LEVVEGILVWILGLVLLVALLGEAVPLCFSKTRLALRESPERKGSLASVIYAGKALVAKNLQADEI
jgi:hypothetical protein